MRNPVVKGSLVAAAIGVLVSAALAGCGSPSASNAGGGRSDTIRLGLAPDEDSAAVLRKFEPFISHLSEETGLEVEPYVGADYTAVIEAMNSGHLDAAWFGPSEYVLATQTVSSGVEAFAAAIQAEDTVDYRTSFVVRSDSGIDGIADFAGKTVAFTDPASTSGHIFGRYALVEAGYEADELFGQVIYSGSHDASLLSVINGQADVAAVSSRKIAGFVESGLVAQDEIKTVFESMEIPADPITYRADLPEDVKKSLRSALLENSPELTASLEGTGFARFDRADDEVYDLVREAYAATGLEPEL
ncbi:phosphate/phosphite/phosphonate ABC transporter substrate-binding protein [Saccharomonospora sp. NPDC046836]|uniref:phosphate/phosphite/phosphonate ABC transporter substrate-binding protein n=1 Tax=Saccharomonospora sp. NPDC046836 TaxID=3156921 RepID=UPI0033E5796B